MYPKTLKTHRAHGRWDQCFEVQALSQQKSTLVEQDPITIGKPSQKKHNKIAKILQRCGKLERSFYIRGYIGNKGNIGSIGMDIWGIGRGVLSGIGGIIGCIWGYWWVIFGV